MSDRAKSLLLYGDTDAGKTTQIGECAQWEFARNNGVTRLISADSNWDPLDDMVTRPDRPLGMRYTDALGRPQAVCIEAWNIQYLVNPFAVLIKLSEGSWPKPKPDGKGLMMAPAADKAKCILSVDDKRVTQYAVEGLHTLAIVLMQDHIRNFRKIAQDIVGDFSSPVDVESAGRSVSTMEKFGKAAPAHYGQVQDFLLFDLAPRFASLPISRVIWTTHEAKGDDDLTGIKSSALGPATIGRAAVARTAFLFGDTLHMVSEVQQIMNATTRQVENVTTRRAYYEKHPDRTLTRMDWPAKISVPMARRVALAKDFPGGFIPLTAAGGLDRYLEWKAELAAKTAEAVAETGATAQ